MYQTWIRDTHESPYPPHFVFAKRAIILRVMTQPLLVHLTQVPPPHTIAAASHVSHGVCSRAGFVPLVSFEAEKHSAVATEIESGAAA